MQNKPTQSRQRTYDMKKLAIGVAVSVASAIVVYQWYRNRNSTQATQPPIPERRTMDFNVDTTVDKNDTGAEDRLADAVTSSHFENVAKKMARTNRAKLYSQPFIDDNIGMDFHPDAVFLIRNVLSTKECQLIIEASEELGFETINDEKNDIERNRCVVKCERLAKAAYHRLGPLLVDTTHFDAGKGITLTEYGDTVDTLDNTSFGQRDCINPQITVERNLQSTVLGPKKMTRAGWVKIKDETEVFTAFAIHIYLNDNYGSGYTQFANTTTSTATDIKAAVYTSAGIKGSIGDALVFRHEILHKSGGVLPAPGDIPAPASEYILRMDAGYRLIRPKNKNKNKK